MNLVVLSGRLVKDPELKFGQSGKAYTRFTIAVDKAFSSDSKADFFNCVAFGKTAEFIGEYFRKGKKILLQGKLQTSVYEAEGKKNYSVNVMVDSVEFADSKTTDAENQHINTSSYNKMDDAPKSEPEEFNTIDDDDFPF